MPAVQMMASDWEGGFAIPGFPIPPVGTFLGGRLESHDPVVGVLRVSYPTKPEYATPAGAVMGGIIAAFLDDTMSPLVMAASGGEKFPVTLDLHTTYFKPVPIGPRTIVEARIDRMGGSAVFTIAHIIGQDGEILVRAIQTAMLRTVGGENESRRYQLHRPDRRRRCHSRHLCRAAYPDAADQPAAP